MILSTKVPPRMVKSKPEPDLITSLLTDLDYMEKGPVTDEELAEVRRSLGLE